MEVCQCGGEGTRRKMKKMSCPERGGEGGGEEERLTNISPRLLKSVEIEKIITGAWLSTKVSEKRAPGC